MPDAQSAADAIRIAAQVVNDYGTDAPQAYDAVDAAVGAVLDARTAGVTDDEIRNA
ncbi:hypothetical protein [Streptomyces sp. NPDC017941]|uniref:hypothetical protein n=1 Tax=unclassified Streptomyces TaxID=2593676 RepID=UPI0037B0B1F5